MKVLIIGASGTIGRAVTQALAASHQVVRATRSQGDCRVDIASTESLRRCLAEVAPFDAVVCAAGAAKFGALETLTDDKFQFSLANKLMGQVNLARLSLRHINDNGSVTLTSGVLAQEPMTGSAAISLVNAGLEGFVRAAALEMPRGIRINVVSPPWVSETLEAMGRDGSTGIPAARVAAAYVESVEGRRTGQVLDARAFASS
jgi:NAD(P)-dependent dehydrogenase (short-subunit alcohol dehydrogenase family)